MKSNKSIYILVVLVLVILVATIIPSCKPESNCDAADPTTYTLTTPFRFPEMTIPPNNALTEEGIELGRFLFFDTTLAFNKSTSCGSCHNPKYGFADANLKTSINAKGIHTKRNTPALLNAGYQNKYFYDGRSESLDAAIDDALTNEMFVEWPTTIEYLKNNTFYAASYKKAFGCDAITKENSIKAIAQFIRTIISSGESEIDRTFFKTNNYTLLNPAAARGYLLFVSARADCFHCHFTNILTTDNLFHNDGLQNSYGTYNFPDNGRGVITGAQTDNGKMKTPTLRNIALTAPYMHNGQFNTLREVIDFYADSVHLSPTLDANMIHTGNIRLNLTNSERDDLVAFLESMTDTVIINNPKFQNPFKP